MHYKQAENLFREYLERQGWQYWTEAEFRRQLGLNKGDAAPDFTILDASGAPRALVEVSEFEIDSEEELIPVKTSRLLLKVRKKANQLRKVLDTVRVRFPFQNLPVMVVLFDPCGAQTHQVTIMQKLLGLSSAISFNPIQGKAHPIGAVLTKKGSLLAYAARNAHLSAIAALRIEEVKAYLSGFEREIRQIKYENFSDFIKNIKKIYEKYCRRGIDVEEKIPVLEIYQNPSANVPWGRELWGQFDRVWGLIDEKNYGLVYNGLLPAHAGILEGVSLPDPVHSSRASGFYDE